MSEYNNRVNLFIALSFTLLFSYFALQHIEIHLTLTALDASPAGYAVEALYPSRFEGDTFGVMAEGYRISSLLGATAGFLSTKIGLSPFLTQVTLTYLQFILTGTSIYFITLQMTNSRVASILAIILTFSIRPWDWNLSYYRDLTPESYPAQLALAFLILAFLFLLQNRKILVVIFIVMGGLIHPAMGFYALAIWGCWWLWGLYKKEAQTHLSDLGLISLTFFITMLPSIYLIFTLKDPIPAALIASVIKHSPHHNPFTHYIYFEDYRAMGFYAWLLLGFLSLREQSNLSSHALRLWITTVVASACLILFHFIGARLEIVYIMQFAPARATYFVSLLTVPLVCLYLWEHLKRKNYVASVLVLTTLFMFLFTEWHVYRWLIFCFFLQDISQGHLLIWKFQPRYPQFFQSLMAVALLGWLISFYFEATPKLLDVADSLSSPIRDSLLWESPPVDIADNREINLLEVFSHRRNFLIFILSLSILWILVVKRRTIAKSSYLNLVILMPMAIVLCIQLSNEANQLYTTDQNLYQAQLWARNNTPEDSIFIGAVKSWRARSERGYRHIPIGGLFVYLNDRRLLTNFEGLEKWFFDDLSEYDADFTPSDLYHLTNQELVALQTAFSGDYLVRPTWIQKENGRFLEYVIVYENAEYQIFDLNQPIAPLINPFDREISAEVPTLPSEGYILDANYAGGVDSLRPLIILKYQPERGRTFSNPINFMLNERQIYDFIWSQPNQNYWLTQLNISYVYIDEVWWAETSEIARNSIKDESKFEELFFIETNNQMRGVYRVLPSETVLYPETFEKLDLAHSIVSKLLYDNWATLNFSSPIFMPSDNFNLKVTEIFTGVITTEDLEGEVIENWRYTKSADDLQAAGFEYLLVDDIWWQYLAPNEITVLNDEYALIQEWQVGTAFFRLYKIK